MKLHRGWLVVIGVWLIMFYSIGVVLNCFSLFLTPISEECGFSHTAVSAILTFYSMGALITTIFAGKISLKISCKKMIIISGIIIAACTMGYSFCTSILQFYVMAAILGGMKGIGTLVPATILINRWFIKKRGTAMGIAMSGSGVGAMIFAPILAKVIESMGIEAAFRVEAALIFVVILAALILIKENPEIAGAAPYGYDSSIKEESAKTDGAPDKLMSIIGTKQFIFITIAALLIGLVMLGSTNQMPSFLTSSGFSMVFASMIISIESAVLIGGKIFYGAVNDRLGNRKGTVYVYFMWIAAIACLILVPKVNILVYVLPVLLGLGIPLGTVSMPIWVNDIFSKRNYAIVYPVIMGALLLGQALGTVLMGALVDVTGGYTFSYCIVIGLSAISFVLIETQLKSKEKGER